MHRFIRGIIQTILILLTLVLVISRLWFSDTVEKIVLPQMRHIPLVGQVLGIAWEKSGEIAPALTQKSVKFADKVEQGDLGIDETIQKALTDGNLSGSISRAIDIQVKKQVSSLKELPGDMLQKTEQKIRNEMYNQICGDWKESSNSAVNKPE